MTSKPRWGYKRSAMVLRPWIVQLLVRGDLKQRAQKVQVLQNVRGPRRSDGSVMKELTDGQSYIKAIFTAEAMKDYKEKCQDDSAPPSINDALLILTDYRIEFLPHECCHWSEFVVEVKRFTLWSYQEGFGLKQSPVNSMDNEEVKKKAVAMWKQWRESQAQGSTLDSSLSSLPLSQLLEEMGMVSDSHVMEEDEVQPQGQDSSDVPHNVLANYDEDCDIENFIIPELEEKILAAIPEWQPGYQPQPTPTSGSCKSSGDGSEHQNSPRASLRKRCVASSEQTAKEDGLINDGVQKAVDDRTQSHGGKDDGEGGVTAVDVEIQVSQSLWENFLLTAREPRKDATTQACSQAIPNSKPQTSHTDSPGGYTTNPHPQVEIREKQVVTETDADCAKPSEDKQLNSGKETRASSVEVLESSPDFQKDKSGVIQTSQNLLSSPEETRSSKKPRYSGEVRTREKPKSYRGPTSPDEPRYPKRARQQSLISDSEPMVIDDSFVEDFPESESPAQFDSSGKDKTEGFEGSKQSRVKTEKDQNDNDSPIIVDISSSQELSPVALECTSNKQNDLEDNGLSLDKTEASEDKGLRSQMKDTSLQPEMSDVIMIEEREEENRLYQLSKVSRSHGQGHTGRSGIGEDSCDNGMLGRGKSFSTIADQLSSHSERCGVKRKLSSSDSEVSRSKKSFVYERKTMKQRTCSSLSVYPNENTVSLDMMKKSVNSSKRVNTVDHSEEDQASPASGEQLSEDNATVTANQNEEDIVDKSRLQTEALADVHPQTAESGMSKLVSSPDVEVIEENARLADPDCGASVEGSSHSGQLSTNSLLNDAQIVSSGEPMTSSGEPLISSGEQPVHQQTSKEQGKTKMTVASSPDTLSENPSPTRLMIVTPPSHPQTTVTSSSPQPLSSNQPPPRGTHSEVSKQTTPSHSLPSYQPPPHVTRFEVSNQTTPSHSLPSYQPPPHEVSPKTTPVHSLPSYQTSLQPSCTSKTSSRPGSKTGFDKTFGGLLDSPPVSPAGRRLLELSFSDGLMKQMEACLSRT